MSFLNSFDISASGMTAQRQRLDIAAENISNMNSKWGTISKKDGRIAGKPGVFFSK